MINTLTPTYTLVHHARQTLHPEMVLHDELHFPLMFTPIHHHSLTSSHSLLPTAVFHIQGGGEKQEFWTHSRRLQRKKKHGR